MKNPPLGNKGSCDARLTRDELVAILSATEPDDIEVIRRKANDMLLRNCGSDVYYRGLIEFSNDCSRDCLYCGIRLSNRAIKRYCMSLEGVAAAARWCADQGYGSMVLQSGERRDEAFIHDLVRAVRRIKSETKRASLPQGLGITLCVGEQTRETYERFFEAGAHRYLLRIETSNPELFARIHPAAQHFESRLDCLRCLREVGFQVGTGVMIGLPGQRIEDLADDVQFFVREDIDMVGMGPFIPHAATPLGRMECPPQEVRTRLTLLMIAATRLSMPDINIVATTALQALDERGRQRGLAFGANILMPVLTPAEVRQDYLLYPGKPCLDETAEEFRVKLEKIISAMGRTVARDQWGDSPHALKRNR